MALLSVEIEQLRCIERAKLDLDAPATLITGPNGSGKTTLLEAIYVLGRGRSFRTARLETAIRHGQHSARVVGAIEGQGRQFVIGVEPRRGETEARIAGEPVESLAELSTAFPVQAIDPGVHKLIEEGPIRRRRFLDWGVFHVEHSYLRSWHRFHRGLRQRNAALRLQSAPELLDAWDHEFVEAGHELDRARDRYLAQVRELLESTARVLLEQDVTVEYMRGWPRDSDLLQLLRERRIADYGRRMTTVGPHRADLDIRVSGKRARDIVSRGQQKLLAAGLILGQLKFHQREHNLQPTLLLDDPAAELDATRLRRLLEVVAEVHAQHVITALQKTSLDPLGTPGRWFHVEQGRASQML